MKIYFITSITRFWFGNILNLLFINSNEYADFLTKSFVSIAFALAKSYDIGLNI